MAVVSLDRVRDRRRAARIDRLTQAFWSAGMGQGLTANESITATIRFLEQLYSRYLDASPDQAKAALKIIETGVRRCRYYARRKPNSP